MSVATLSETRVHDRTLEFTRDAVLDTIYDTAFDHSPLLAAMLGRLQNQQFGAVALNGRGNTEQTGGESIFVRHNLGGNTTAKTLTGPWDTVDTSPSDTVRHSRVNWRHYSATTTFSDTDMLINRGDSAISSMIEHETRNAVTSLGDLAAGHLYSGSTGTQATGLQTLAGTGTIQGIDPTVYTTFFSRGLSARGTAVGTVADASGSFAAQGLADMRTLYNNASEGAVQPHAIYTHWDVFGFYEGTLQPQERFTNTAVADAGFQQLAFKNAPVFPDAKCPTGEMYTINFDFFKAIVLAGANLSFGPIVPAIDQEARTSKLMLKFNDVVFDRRFINKMDTISA